jgi:hypothetical protein
VLPVPEFSVEDLTYSSMLGGRLTTDVEHARRIIRGVGQRLEDVLTPEHRKPIISELGRMSTDLEALLDELQPERRYRDDEDD